MKNILSEIGLPLSTPSSQILSSAIPSDALTLLDAALDNAGQICVVGLASNRKEGQPQPKPVVLQEWFAPGDKEAAVAKAMELNERGYDAYWATSTYKSNKREADNVESVCVLKLDLDVSFDDPKKYPSKNAAVLALEAFCRTLRLPKPVVVDSGGGLHVYWPLSVALAPDKAKQVSEKLKSLCSMHGLRADPCVTSDLARILRVPGTKNYKQGVPREVKLLTKVRTFDTDNFVELIEAVGAPAPVAVSKVVPLFSDASIQCDLKHLQNLKADDLTVQLAGFKPKKFSLILERSLAGTGCNQVKHAFENQISLDEPRWRAALSIAQFCEDRDEAIHSISKGHANYSPAATIAKAHAIPRPMRCETFKSNWPEQCSGCAHQGKITSPIVLGIEPDAVNLNALADAIKIVRDAEARSKVGDSGAAFEDHVLDALREIKQNSPAEFQRLRTALKESNRNLSMKALDAALAEDVPGTETRNAASALIRLAKDKCTFFHDSDSAGHGVFERDGHRECWALNSKGFSEWLSHTAYRESGIAPSENTLATALSTLAGAAKFDGQEMPVAVRVAKHGGDYYIDLCDAHWQAIRINASSWQLVAAPPVQFVRTNAMRPLPSPEAGGDIRALWDFVNVEPADQLLVLAWMIECFRVDTPFPILELYGEQGSAKSFTQNILRELIDPNKANLRAKPKTIDDLFVTAKASHMVSLENLSHLAPDFQDALCAIATGAGHGGRQLYSDSDEHAFTVKRPSMLNGISVCATRSDLMDRTLLINLPTIATRRTESDLQAAFEKQKSQLFGALLDLFVGALKSLPAVKINSNELPRMADFACLGEALYRSLGGATGDFLSDYLGKRQQGIRQTIESNPVACALTAWLLLNPAGFHGTVRDLHDQLVRVQTGSGGQWPKTLHAFGDALRRAAPALRTLGHQVNYLGHKRAGHQWQIQ